MGPPEAGDNTSRILQLRGVIWKWRADAPKDARDTAPMGVLAQDVEKVFPQLVSEDAQGVKSVDYAGLIAPVIEAIKELDARLRVIEELLQRQDPETA